jgi:flagellar hook-associated protein 3 FlgL
MRHFLDGLLSARERSARAVEGLTDGKRVRSASDDPVAAQTSLTLRARLARLEGMDRSAEAARADLATLDRTLGEVASILSEAETEAMAGASFPHDTANDVHARTIEALRDQLLALANTSQSGRFLYGGTETLTQPFAADGTYGGDDAEAVANIDLGQQVGVTLSGRRVFVDGEDLFNLLDDLAQALRDNRTDDVAALIPGLERGLDHVVALRAEIGVRAQEVDATFERRADEGFELVKRISELEDVDVERVALDLQAALTSSEALSTAAARVLGRSLFDYLG